MMYTCLGIGVGLIVLVVLFFVYVSIASSRERREYQENADEYVGYIVHANNALFEKGGLDRPAHILVAFDQEDQRPDEELFELARYVASFTDRKPQTTAEKQVARIVRDETYRPFERHRLPDDFTGGRPIYSIHIWVERAKLPGSILQHPFVRCLILPRQKTRRVMMAEYRKADSDWLED